MTDRERIESLIPRNDFNTAEAIMRKSSLPPETRRELEALIETRKRLQERERRRKRRKEHFLNRLRKFNPVAWKGFYAVYILLNIIIMIVSPYCHAACEEPPDQRVLFLDFLVFLVVLDAALFWGLVILQAVLDRDSWSLERFRGVFLAWIALLLLSLLILWRRCG